ncbi:MAG: hypothetical protein AAB394_02620 [Patescibacteria group bacterium]
MIIHRVKIRGNLLGDFYTAKSNSKGTIVFMVGLPSYLHKSEFCEELSLLGYNILQPFYYGSWVSGGNFSIKNCVNTLTDSLKSIENGYIFDIYTNKKIIIDSQNIFLGGISFGSNIIQSLKTPEKIKKIFLISAVPIFKKEYCKMIGFDGKTFVKFIRAGFPYAYRSKNWNELVKEFSGQGKILSQFTSDVSRIGIYQGSRDKISPQIIEQYLQKENLKIKINSISGAGHALNEYDQKQIASTVDLYLQTDSK